MQLSEAHCGAIVAIEGTIVDARFAARMPQIGAVLEGGGEARDVIIEVCGIGGEKTVHGLVLKSSPALCLGMAVRDTGSPLSVPVLIGVAIGWWLDHAMAQRFSWTLALLPAGAVLGALNAWVWISREGRNG